MTFSFRDYFEFLLTRRSRKDVCEFIESAVKRWHLHHPVEAGGLGVTDFVRSFPSGGHHWGRLIADTPEMTAEEMQDLVLLLGLKPSDLIRDVPEPWDDWRDGSFVIALLALRSVQVKSRQAKNLVPRLGLDYRDFQAFLELGEVLRRLGLGFRYEPMFIPVDEPDGEWKQQLARRLKRGNVGLIASIGSANVNPASAVLARQICEGMDRKVELVWRDPPKDDPLSRPTPVTKPGAYSGKVFRARAEDDKTTVAGKGTRHDDVGILALDARSRPLKAVFAGHSGLATIATVKILDRPRHSDRRTGADVERFLQITRAARDPKDWLFGEEGRVVQVVGATRKKPGGSRVDDLVLEDWFWLDDPWLS